MCGINNKYLKQKIIMKRFKSLNLDLNLPKNFKIEEEKSMDDIFFHLCYKGERLVTFYRATPGMIKKTALEFLRSQRGNKRNK